MSESKRYDAVIVGGGVIGSAIAFQLAKEGRKVALLEKGRLAGQSTSAAAGMLGAQSEMGELGPLFGLARFSRALFPQLAEELRELCGIDIGLVRKGALKTAFNETEAERLQRLIRLQNDAGERAYWLTREQLREEEPAISADALGAMCLPDEGHVLAPELSIALAGASAAMGVTIKEYTEATSLHITGGRVEGVTTTEERIHCDSVVLASGVWSSQLARQAGLELPLYPVKGECFSVLCRKPLISSTVFLDDCYLVPKKGGRMIVGATMKERSYDQTVSLEGIRALMDKAAACVPAIVHTEWEKAWAGLRPQTPDGLPYIGESSKCRGLYAAAGHYRNGILLAPVTAAIIADLIAGRESEFELAPFRLERWDERGGAMA